MYCFLAMHGFWRGMSTSPIMSWLWLGPAYLKHLSVGLYNIFIQKSGLRAAGMLKARGNRLCRAYFLAERVVARGSVQRFDRWDYEQLSNIGSRS